MRDSSRRGVIAGLLSLLLRRANSAPTEVPSRGSFVRVYRVDAVILLLGLPIYRRAGVGAGKASLEETGAGADLRRTLFFAGGSDPNRARGLSRLGWMREVAAGPAAAPSDISYFGVLTSSPEESLENARKSSDPPAGRSVFDAVSGRNTTGRSRSAITQFDFPSSAAWSDQALIDRAQSLFRGDVKWRDTSWPNLPRQAPPTFLLQIASLFQQRAKRASGRYVYNEQEYLLELEAQSPARDGLLPFRGKIRNLRTGYETKFKVWLESGSESIVPVRIEYQARSFLKLTFEAVPA